MRGIISWNGIRSDQFGIQVEKYPDLKKPQRKFDKYSVPGRSGDIIMMQEAWDNVEQEYDIFAGGGGLSSAPAIFGEITEWLTKPNGYCELWDEFDPDHFRLAYFTGPLAISALAVGRMGRVTITFNCKPQRYLIEGKAPIVFTSSPDAIYNFTGYHSKPLVFVERSAAGGGTVTVAGTLFTIKDIPESGIYIDCEELNCYGMNGENLNNKVSSSTSEFAELAPGANSIGFSDNVSKVTITPRWFEI